MNTFKYQSDYDLLIESCPPDYYSSSNINEAFRWVFNEMGNSENFKSAYHKNPPRFLDKNDKEKCKSLGLSFFDNESGAIKRFEEIRKSIGSNIYKTIGSNLARVLFYQVMECLVMLNQIKDILHTTLMNQKLFNKDL